LVETAATADAADWKEMLNWGRDIDANHPLRRRYPHQYPHRVLPERAVPGITAFLAEFHDRLAALQTRFLRIIAVGLGAAEGYFDTMMRDGATLSRAINYPAMASAPDGRHVWAAAHGDINLITALPRATEGRLSVVQFAHPSPWTILAPLPTCIDADHPVRWAPMEAGAMLDQVLWDINLTTPT